MSASARILDKVTMTADGRWITMPFIRDERGDRPAIPPPSALSGNMKKDKPQ